MRKPWQTREWREKRAAFIEGKSCEWCSSTEYLTIDHLNNVYGNFEYGKIAFQLFNDYFAEGKNKEELNLLEKKTLEKATLYYYLACPKCGYSVQVRKKLKPKYRCWRCKKNFSQPKKKLSLSTLRFLNRRLFQLFKESHKEEIDAVATPKIQQLNEDYFAFKNVLILCRKCAYARLKGMVLCKVCKKKYHPRRFSMCWECFKKTEEGKHVLERREKRAEAEKLIGYTHPWCGKEFMIEKQDWEIEAEPQMCCIEHCGDPNNCEIAAKYWNEEEP